MSKSEILTKFETLATIPHCSYETDKMRDFLADFAKDKGCEVVVDSFGNVHVYKGKPKICLQSHYDMVCMGDAPKIEIVYGDDGYMRAKNSSLGADNGIGVAIMMQMISEFDDIECLFTNNEEVGMVGANGLQPGFSKGDILINLDSEDEGLLFAGCAGGIDVNVRLEYKDQEPLPEGDIAVRIALTGLRGGHSGMDIILGRANANKLLARFLKEAIAGYGARLSSFEGGTARNAIPREAYAVVTIPEADADGLWELASDYLDIFQTEYKGIEESISLRLERVELPKTVVPEEIQDGVIGALDACINGVQSMLTEFPGIVESSTNMARVTIGGGLFTATFLVRSSSESRKDYVASQIESAMNLAGAEVEFAGGYNGWAPNASSAVLQTLRRAYEEVMGVSPEVTVVHAGLECGIIQGVMPDMDMISIGPDIRSPHSPDEKVHIASVARTWEVLKKGLELV